MRQLQWRDSAAAAAPLPFRVERFRNRGRTRAHLLADLQAHKVHWKHGSNTKPCSNDGGCPLCGDATFEVRYEHYSAALVRDAEAHLWVPVVAVFTPGGARKLLDLLGPKGHRGWLIDVTRGGQSTAKGGVMQVARLSQVDPVYPAFDLDPYLLRLWFPTETREPVPALPPPLAFAADALPERPEPQPVRRSPEQVEKLKGLLSTFLHRSRAESEVPAAAPAGPVEPAGSADGPDRQFRGELHVFETAADPANYQPRRLVRPAADDADSVPRLLADLAAHVPYLNGKHPAGQNGGGK